MGIISTEELKLNLLNTTQLRFNTLLYNGLDRRLWCWTQLEFPVLLLIIYETLNVLLNLFPPI